MNRKVERVVVTGGAGLIGSAVVWELNRRGIDDILIVDRLGRTEKWRHLTPLRFTDYLETDDFQTRLDTAPTGFGAVDTVIHLGACSSTTERDAAYLVRNNYRFSQQMATWALARSARMVYASSAATYGARETGLREDLPSSSLRPLNAYGWSKHVFDQWAERHGVLERTVGIKYFNVYGPNEDHKGDMRSVVAKAFEQIRDTGVIELFKSYRPEYADGEQCRDFLYVKDAAAMTVHVATASTATGLINAGSGVARSWNDLAQAIFAALGRSPRIEYVDMPDALRERYQYRTEATIDRLRAAGYTQPVLSLEDAVADYVRLYLSSGSVLGDESPVPRVSASK